MLKRGLLAVIILLGSASAANAVEGHDMTAKELLFACTSAHELNDYPVCLVFMAGFHAGAMATLARKPWCEPPNMTFEEEILDFVRVMRTYPQLLELPLWKAIGAAMVTAYPCHRGGK